jgi:hypothetical protein
MRTSLRKFTIIKLFSYEVEFSKPLQTKPIPEGTVKVYFDVIAIEEPGQPKKNEVEFNFENESLKHKYGSTMRKNMFEVSCLFLTFFSNGSIECLRTNLRSKWSCIWVPSSNTLA